GTLDEGAEILVGGRMPAVAIDVADIGGDGNDRDGSVTRQGRHTSRILASNGYHVLSRGAQNGGENACKIESPANGRRGGAGRQAGRSPDRYTPGRVPQDVKIEEREAARGIRRDKAEGQAGPRPL